MSIAQNDILDAMHIFEENAPKVACEGLYRDVVSTQYTDYLSPSLKILKETF